MTERELERRAQRRLAVLRHVEEVSFNVAATCRYYGISRQCYYAWLRRYEADGLEGLKDPSSRPHRSPRVTQAEVTEKIVWLRKHYHFGPAKIAMYLARYHDLSYPDTWSWAIDTRNIDTAFSILAGFAPSEVSSRWPLALDGEAALELPGAAAHPGYPLALAVSARFAADRGDVTVTEELCRGAAEANARQASPDWRVEEVICDARAMIAVTTGAFADANRLTEQAAVIARTGGDLADTSLQLGHAASGYLFVGDAPRGVPLARDALTLARQIGDPALIATGLLIVGMTVAETDPEQAHACLRESLELSTALGYQTGSTTSGPPGSHFL